MPRQLTFWPGTERRESARAAWEGLDERQREALVIALAKLIGKETQPRSPEPQAEDGHER
jgi:hypothetical protein